MGYQGLSNASSSSSLARLEQQPLHTTLIATIASANIGQCNKGVMFLQGQSVFKVRKEEE
ncbi:MAG: hypothetical protein ACE5IA_05385 [Dehalococcoidia bacterium]